MNNYLFTSESVTEGHPDKVCDQISDTILDAILQNDPEGRVACETLVTTNLVVISGEITTKNHPDYEGIVRDTIRKIGYTDASSSFDADGVDIKIYIDEQSSHIAQGVDVDTDHEQGAGDQGLMFGFACNETKELMPAPIYYSHLILETLAKSRHNGNEKLLLPDSKSQVSLDYKNGKPYRASAIVVSTQHDPSLKQKDVKEIIRPYVVNSLPEGWMCDEKNFFVNPTGRFVIGGPVGDCGLTGRKIIVDTYGGFSRHGGGAFSGKDPSKVDRSAAYMARYVARRVVGSGLAERCELQLAYSIGIAEPVSILANTFGTGITNDKEITKLISDCFDFKPYSIIRYLNLKKPIYKNLAAYGHFGRNEYPWEIDKKNKAFMRAVKDRLLWKIL